MAMSSGSFGRDRDLESQCEVLLEDNTCSDIEPHQKVLLGDDGTLRDRWRSMYLFLHSIELFVKRNGSSSSPVTAADSQDQCSEISGIALPSPPKVSVDIHSGGNHDENCNNKRLQHENVARIVKTKNLDSLREFGGVQGFAEALDTDLESGVSGDYDDLVCRDIAFFISDTKEGPESGFFRFLLKSCNSYIILLLSVCAVLSIGFGIKEEGLYTGWYEGGLIIAGVIMLVSVHSIRNFWYARKQKMSNRNEPVVHVLRAGGELPISISKVVLGEIVCLKVGHQVPADGLFVSGESLKTDNNEHGYVSYENPFLFYGEKVVSGDGRMLVTSLGKDTLWGEMMSEVTGGPTKKTPLQVQLDKVNTCIQIIGLLVTILILVILFLRFHFGSKDDDGSGSPDLKAKSTAISDFMNAIENIVRNPKGKISILTASLTVLLVGMTEGLPFVVILAIFYWNKKILSGRGTALDSLACINMAAVTTICTDKAGGLTIDQMKVDTFFIGEDFIGKETVIAPNVLRLLGFGHNNDPLAPTLNKGSPLHSWASLKLRIEMDVLKQQSDIFQAEELDPDKEGRETLTRKNRDSGESTSGRCIGAATTILATCSLYYDCSGEIKVIDKKKRTKFEQFITKMQTKHLKTIAYACRNVDVTPEEDLILLGLVGLRQSSRKAIEACISAGVSVKLVSGDDVSELEVFAQQCGIPITSSEAVVVGENFRNFTEKERMDKVDRISVMGNCLPSDRLLLVKCLKKKGHLVAVAGARTDESPALKEADVGIALGSLSTEKAKESSDIIISDGNLNFVVTPIIMCGRCAHENIRKFLQLQLTMSISWFLINLITTACFGDAPISAIESLWVFFIVTILGGLALLTEPPSKKVMEKPPTSTSGPLVTRTMWRNIALQTSYQISVLLSFRFKGEAILDINQKIINIMIFNSFVLCQVFNQLNAREPEMKNLLEGIFRNFWFWLAIAVTVVFQEAFMEIARVVAGDRPRLNFRQWGVCLLIGTVSLLLDCVGKCTSDFVHFVWMKRNGEKLIKRKEKNRRE